MNKKMVEVENMMNSSYFFLAVKDFQHRKIQSTICFYLLSKNIYDFPP